LKTQQDVLAIKLKSQPLKYLFYFWNSLFNFGLYLFLSQNL